MKSELAFQETAVRENSIPYREEQEPYLAILSTHIEQYLSQLKQFEARTRAAGASAEKLLPELIRLNDSVLQRCAEFEDAVSHEPEALRRARTFFREKTQAILSKSNFIQHARTWPRGHQGDYQILESAYRNMSSSTGMGYYVDLYCLQTSLCLAVRERKNSLRRILETELAARTQPAVLDVACGSCRDVFEIAPAIEKSSATFTCVDFDSEALDFAANRMSYVKMTGGEVAYRKYNAFKMISHERNSKEFGPQDIIYSVGFFDYLKDEMLTRMLGALYQLLTPGGRLVTSFKDCTRYAPQFYRWMVDWDGFFLRTEADCRRILENAGIPADRIEFERDKTGVIMFFVATR